MGLRVALLQGRTSQVIPARRMQPVSTLRCIFCPQSGPSRIQSLGRCCDNFGSTEPAALVSIRGYARREVQSGHPRPGHWPNQLPCHERRCMWWWPTCDVCRSTDGPQLKRAATDVVPCLDDALPGRTERMAGHPSLSDLRTKSC